MKAVNIEWNFDYDEDAYDCKELTIFPTTFPTEIEIPDGMTDEEEISDYISNVTGFCHKGFVLD